MKTSKKRTKSLLFLVVCFILSACNEEEDKKCNDGFIQDMDGLKQAFITSHSPESDISDLETKLRRFLASHDDEECEVEGKKYHIHSDVKNLLSEMDFKSLKSGLISTKGIYGEDNRTDYEDLSSSLYQTLSHSVAAQVASAKIGSDGQLTAATLGESQRLCLDERFYEQMTPASCSGFLAAPDTIVTAGHCMTSSTDCPDYRWVFGITRDTTHVDFNDVYSCSYVEEVVVDESSGLDYAVVKLDRPVIDRSPLTFRSAGKVSSSSDLVVMGYPSGLPIKISDGAKVRRNIHEHYFVTNLDTFAGNSGSPVMNAQTGLVEGILVRGDQDYAWEERDGGFCQVAVRCPDDGCEGEEVVRITSVEGLPKTQIDEIDEVMALVYSSTPKYQESDSHLLVFGTYEANGHYLSAKKFLDVCVAHVFHEDDPSSWDVDVEYSCSDSDEFKLVYDYFEEVAFALVIKTVLKWSFF